MQISPPVCEVPTSKFLSHRLCHGGIKRICGRWGKHPSCSMQSHSNKAPDDEIHSKLSEFGARLARSEEEQLLAALRDAAKFSERQQSEATELSRQKHQQQNQQLKNPELEDGKRQQQQQQQQRQQLRQRSLRQLERTSDVSADTPEMSATSSSRDEDFVTFDSNDAASRPGKTERSNEAAGFLANVMSSPDAHRNSQDLRPEEFTRQKEEERKHNVEIITVDQHYVPSQEGEAYQPTVATWGLFPRPNDISKAYGGGRTLRPGQALETDESRVARKKRVAEALAKFKQDSGSEVEPAVLKQAQAAMAEGRRTFDSGDLIEALPWFRQASKLMPLPSVLGGEARLKLAVTLDSLGQNEEAKKLYTQLKGHPTSLVSKTAKRLLGGFQAAAFLKADQISYRADTAAYQQYFTSVESLYDFTAGSSSEDADLRLPLAISVAIIAAPLLTIGCRIFLVAK